MRPQEKHLSYFTEKCGKRTCIYQKATTSFFNASFLVALINPMSTPRAGYINIPARK
jgi:hypothetical protein